MKRLIKVLAVLMAVSMIVLAFAGCGQSNSSSTAESKTESKSESTASAEPIVGGWTLMDATALTIDSTAKKSFDEAVKEGAVGVVITPIALLATKKADNTVTYCFLAKQATEGAESSFKYTLLYVTSTDNAPAAILSSVELDPSSKDYGQSTDKTDWAVTTEELPELKGDAGKALDSAMKEYTGAVFEPFACIASQIVSGTNYCYVCRMTKVVQNPTPEIAIVFVYQPLSGAAEISDVVDVNLEAMSIRR